MSLDEFIESESFLNKFRNSFSNKFVSLFAAGSLFLASCGLNNSQNSCQNDYDCPGTELCVNGSCSGSCSNDYDCPGNELCIDNKCSSYCDNTVDCPGLKICDDGLCVEYSQPSNDEFLDYNIKTTDEQGRAEIINLPVQILDEEGNPVEGVKVYGATNGENHLIMAVDPKGNYYPESVEGSLDTIVGGLATQKADGIETKRGGLLDPISLTIIGTIYGVGLLGYKILSQFKKYDPGQFMGLDQNVNKYCMTMEQIQNNNISVPAGIIELVFNQANVDFEEIKISYETPLKDIVKDVIEVKYGEHQGYEVWIPHTEKTFCADFEGAVCEVTDYQLEKIWDPDVPHWRINGPCEINQEFCEGYGEFDCGNGECILDVQVCDGNYIDCSNGADENNQYCPDSVPDCFDECSYGERKCIEDDWKQCGDYDSDNCSEWSSIKYCSSNETCSDGYCVEESGGGDTRGNTGDVSCEQKGGYLAADGLGGIGCWFESDKGKSCDYECAQHDMDCVDDNWNDDKYCSIGKHFWGSGVNCIENTDPGAPYLESGSNVQYRNSLVDQKCEKAHDKIYDPRLCVCE